MSLKVFFSQFGKNAQKAIWTSIATLAIASLVVFWGFHQVTQETPIAILSATELDRQYTDDMVTADVRYAGKLVEITGVRGNAEKSRDGRYFLAAGKVRIVRSNIPSGFTSVAGARSALQQASLDAVYVPGLVFYVRSQDWPMLSRLGGAESVTVRGICRGSNKRPNLIPDYTVEVDDCEIVARVR